MLQNYVIEHVTGRVFLGQCATFQGLMTEIGTIFTFRFTVPI